MITVLNENNNNLNIDTIEDRPNLVSLKLSLLFLISQGHSKPFSISCILAMINMEIMELISVLLFSLWWYQNWSHSCSFFRVFMMRATINKTHIPYFGVNRVLWTFIAHAHGCQLCTQFHALLTGCRCTWIGLRKFTCKLYLQICMWNVQILAILIDIEHERSRTHMQFRFHSYWVLFGNSIYMRVYDIAVTQHLH